jgi:hypothetical protein
MNEREVQLCERNYQEVGVTLSRLFESYSWLLRRIMV